MTSADPLFFDDVDHELLRRVCEQLEFTRDAEREIDSLVAGSDKNGGDVIEYAKARTVDFRKSLVEWADLFGWGLPIGNHRILIVPDARFDARSYEFSGHTFVLVNTGVMDLISFLFEIDIISSCCPHPPDDALAKQLALWVIVPGLTLAARYFNAPFHLPHLRRFFNETMNLAEGPLLITAELFIVLHEIGHIEAGHLRSGKASAEQELAADAFAIRSLARGGVGPLLGPLHLLSTLSHQERFAGLKRPGAAPLHERLLAIRAFIASLGIDLEDKFESELLEGEPPTVASQESAWHSMNATPQKTLMAEFLWGCETIATEAGIKFDAPLRRGREAKKAKEIADAQTAAHTILHPPSGDIVALAARYSSLPRDWDVRKAFIVATPQLLTPDSLRHFSAKAHMLRVEGAPGAYLAAEDHLLLERCAQVGTAETLPIMDSVVVASMHGTIDEIVNVLRAQPHVASEAGLARARDVRIKMLERQQLELAHGAELTAALIEQALLTDLEDAIRLAHEMLPVVPSQIARLAQALAAAENEKNLLRQVEVCRAALLIAESEPSMPSWALRFRAKLDSLPQF